MALMKQDMKNSLGFLLHDATRLLRKRFEARGSEYGLSSAQWRLLVSVKRLGEPTQAQIAERLEIEPISVSRLVDRMEAAGWVERLQDEADRRIRRVRPTERSRAMFDDLRTLATEVYDVALAGLSPDERAALLHALATMIANLAEPDAEADAPAARQGEDA